jgi:hypothetical protein
MTAPLRKAPRARFIRRPAVPAQHQRAAELAKELGMEKPVFFWSHDAETVIARLEQMVSQPVLSGFSASTGAVSTDAS